MKNVIKKVTYLTVGLLFVFINCVLLSCSSWFAEKESLQDSADLALDKQVDCDYLFMLYLDGDNSLNDEIFYNILQCEYGLYLHNLNNPEVSLKILVLWDGITETDYYLKTHPKYKLTNVHKETALYELGERSTEPSKSIKKLSEKTKDLSFYAGKWMYIDKKQDTFEVNMGDTETLKGFLSFAAKHYKANKTVLLVANHGGGPFSYTEADNVNNRLVCVDEHSVTGNTYYGASIDTNKIASTIREGFGKKLDIVMYDACFCGTVECLYELKDICSYVVASPNSIPGLGYPYHNIIANNFTKNQSMEQIAVNTVYEYSDYYKARLNKDYSSFTYKEVSSPTLSAYKADSTSLNKLKAAIDLFADTIIKDDNNKLFFQAVTHMFDSGYLYPVNRTGSSLIKDYRLLDLSDVQCLWYNSSYFSLYDIGFLTDKYINNVDNQGSAILNTSVNLQKALDEVILYAWRGDCKQTDEELLAEINPGLYPKLYNNNGLNYYGLGICGSSVELNDSFVKVNPFALNVYQRSSTFGKESEWGSLLVKLFP